MKYTLLFFNCLAPTRICLITTLKGYYEREKYLIMYGLTGDNLTFQ